jgi:nitrate reductase NapE component
VVIHFAVVEFNIFMRLSVGIFGNYVLGVGGLSTVTV